MGSALNSGQFVRNNATGEVGVTTPDPYGVCAEGEITVNTESADQLGNGYPLTDWTVIDPSALSAGERQKFSWVPALRRQAA